MSVAAVALTAASFAGSCSRRSDETESIQLAAVITRVANTTLQMPSGGATTYSLVTAFPNLTFAAPIAVTAPPGETNRLFVVERAGRIKVVSNLSGTPTVGTFLDISGRPVVTPGEQGLLGLAFHPNYASNGFFYVFYSTTATGSTTERVSRFKVSSTNANAADATSEQILIDQVDRATNHNGGDVHFGPDGYLYVSLGDEGNQNDFYGNAQHIDLNFFSGLLRIDVDKKAGNPAPNAHAAVKAGTYAIPADNPFVGATSFDGSTVDPTKVRTEFYAVGLRNPWRFSFDSGTGQLWLGDVGQDTYEEIDLVTKGGNYGWAFAEALGPGPKTKPAGAVAIKPIWNYDHTIGKSITGGLVYRGSALPELVGNYLFADYVSGAVWYLQNDNGTYSPTKIANDAGINSFGLDPHSGDVLVCEQANNTIKRLVRNSGGPIPATLSQTGAFSDLSTLTPNAGIVPYAPNVPFWSDNAIKTRWFSIPKVTDKMTFPANVDDNWTFPAGQVWIKHFEMEMVRGDPSSRRRLETRFLVKTSSGVYGVTYKWNSAQTDADLVADAGLDEQLTIDVNGTPTTQTWHYPSRNECVACHSPVGGLALSFNTRQMNASFTYAGGTANQIQALSDAGYFTAAVSNVASMPKVYLATDTTQSLQTRAQSYLQVNCAQCHQPGGTAQGSWDARIRTRLDLAAIINGALSDNRGDTLNRVIAPQDQGHSMILRRIQAAPNAPRMPPFASNALDQAGIDLVSSWVMSIAYTFEAETLSATGTAPIAPNTDANASAGKWTQLSGTAAGQTIDYPGISLPAGTFTVKFKYKTNNNRAQSTVKIDGTQLGGTIDQYTSSATYPEITLGTVTYASAATHTIRMTILGKNASSSGFAVSADRFTFMPSGPPPPAPAAPSNLVANGGVGQASLSWTDNASDETGFKIERKVMGAADTTYAVVATPGANTQAFTDTVAAGSYTYRVKATNGSGDSTPSNSADATVTAPSVGITNLVVDDNLPAGCVSPNCNRDKWSIQSNFQAGLAPFGDRTYTVESVGNSAILGGPWIRTAADSKNYTMNPLATFTANGSFVYLVIDNRWNGSSGRPAWLTDAAFTDQGYDVVVRQSSTQTFPYSVWRKAITSGSTVNLPALGGTTAPAYFVIVK